jgi:hypothetical protein
MRSLCVCAARARRKYGRHASGCCHFASCWEDTMLTTSSFRIEHGVGKAHRKVPGTRCTEERYSRSCIAIRVVLFTTSAAIDHDSSKNHCAAPIPWEKYKIRRTEDIAKIHLRPEALLQVFQHVKASSYDASCTHSWSWSGSWVSFTGPTFSIGVCAKSSKHLPPTCVFELDFLVPGVVRYARDAINPLRSMTPGSRLARCGSASTRLRSTFATC